MTNWAFGGLTAPALDHWADGIAVPDYGDNPEQLGLYDLLARIEALPEFEQAQALDHFDALYGPALYGNEPVQVAGIRDPGVSLSQFVRMCWPVVEPAAVFEPNWHIDCICEHLEAVTYGQIRRLIINVPPGTAKSLIVSVLWPAWQWLVEPSWRMLCITHSLGLAMRDADRCRSLIKDPFYTETFSPDWTLSKSQAAKRYYSNSRTGSRFSASVGANITGFRAKAIVLDDVLDAGKATSPSIREKTNAWIDNAAANRLNDMRTDPIVHISQRLHEKDPAGHLLAQGGWEHVMLPARFEKVRAFSTVLKDLTHPRTGEPYQYGTDPRTTEGELLAPVRLPEKVLQEMERRGPVFFSGQYQQNPQAGDGLIFVKEYFLPLGENGKAYDTQYWPYPYHRRVLSAVLSIDNNITDSKKSDFTAIAAGLEVDDGYYYEVPLLLQICSLDTALKQVFLWWARLKTGAGKYPKLGEKLRLARIETGAAGTPVTQQEKIIRPLTQLTPTDIDRVIASRAMLKPESEWTTRDREALAAIKALDPPSPSWTQDEWDMVRSCPPLVLNPYPSAGRGNIEERASLIAPTCMARQVRFVCLDPTDPENVSLCKKWLGQHTMLPLGEHDDAVQSTIGIVDWYTNQANKGRSADTDDILAKAQAHRREVDQRRQIWDATQDHEGAQLRSEKQIRVSLACDVVAAGQPLPSLPAEWRGDLRAELDKRAGIALQREQGEVAIRLYRALRSLPDAG